MRGTVIRLIASSYKLIASTSNCANSRSLISCFSSSIVVLPWPLRRTVRTPTLDEFGTSFQPGGFESPASLSSSRYGLDAPPPRRKAKRRLAPQIRFQRKLRSRDRYYVALPGDPRPLAGDGALKPAAHTKELLIDAANHCVVAVSPVAELRSRKRGRVLRVRHIVNAGGDELALAPLGNRLRQSRVGVAGEIEERPALSVFFTHEEQRQRGPEHQNGSQGRPRFARDQRDQALAMRPVPHLVVILQGEHELRGKQAFRRRSMGTPSKRGKLPLVNKASFDRPGDIFAAAEIGVVVAALPRQKCVHSVVEVVRPCRGCPPATRAAIDHASIVEVALGHDVDLTSHLPPD